MKLAKIYGASKVYCSDPDEVKLAFACECGATPLSEAKENELQQFKLGLTFIAIMNKTPIVPVFLKKRKNFFHRYHILVGEPINLHEMCSKIPTIPEIEKAGQLLFEKEKELQTYFEENIERRIK